MDGLAGHYSCDAADGSRLCYRHWYGPNCTLFCRPQNSSQGHYTCDEKTGQKICLEGWYGDLCLQKVTTTYAPNRITSPSHLSSTEWKTSEPSLISSPELKSTQYSISPPITREGQVPVQKESRKTAKEGWMTKTNIGLITGGFALLLCLCAIVMIALLSCRPRMKRVPYSRQRDKKEERSLKRRNSCGKVNPAADINSQYEMSDVFLKVQQVSWTEDGSRQVDDHLVMYNNPLFSAQEKGGHGADNRQLTLDSDWNVVFDL